MGTLTSQSLKWRMSSQWSQIKSQQQIIIKNNYSQQQFLLHSIPYIEQNSIKLYFIRQFSCLPYTPKVICLQKQQTHLIVLVERSQHFFSQWLQQINCQLALLIKLNDVLHGIDTLKNKFGCFIITQRMIQLSVNHNVMVWYNEKFHSNIIQLPLSKVEVKTKKEDNQSVMVRNIIEIFRKNTYFSKKLISMFLGIKTFKELLIMVKRKIHEIQRATLLEEKKQSKYSAVSQNQIKQKPAPYCTKINRKRNSSLFTKKHTNNVQINNINFLKLGPICSPKKRQRSFLLQQTLKLQQNNIIQKFNSQNEQRQSIFKQKDFHLPLKNEGGSSQRYSSSNMSSEQYIKESLLQKKDFFRPWNSFHHNKLKKNRKEDTSMFKKKQCGYKNLMIYQVNEKKSMKDNLQNFTLSQQDSHVYFSPTFKSLSSTHSYKPGQSFDSMKHFSLKSTTGTLKKTREFNDQGFRQLIVSQQQAIKQQSDETYKNSKNYSVETIKQQQKQEKKCSPTVSQDFNQLFSARSSNQCNEENQIRQIQFERVLWGGQ